MLLEDYAQAVKWCIQMTFFHVARCWGLGEEGSLHVQKAFNCDQGK